MANPQPENGHTRINHETMDKLLSLPLSLRELKVIFFVLRKTWGWGKKEDLISLTQMAEATHIARSDVSRAINALIAKRVLKVERKSGRISRMSFNKDYESWDLGVGDLPTVPKKREVLVIRQQGVGDLPTPALGSGVGDLPTTKERKETIQKKDTNVSVAKPREYGNAELNDLIKFASELQFPGQGSARGNRHSASNVLKRFGLDKSKRLVRAAVECQADRFAPTINDFTQLYQRAADLATYYKRRKEKDEGRIGTINTIRP